MKWFFLLLAVVFHFTGCSNLPKVHPTADSAAATTLRGCPNFFPKGKWQFVHSIEAVMPGGRSGFVTGVVVVSSADRSFRCVIMTLEGLALFDAEWDRQLAVHRAIAPFDSKFFAEGLANDIRLLFLHPPGSPVESGFLENGAAVSRYRDSEGEIVDIVSKGNGGWEIRRYAPDIRLLRTVNMAPGKNTGHHGMPQKIELTAHGSQGYKLIMSLVEAVPLDE